MRAFLLIFCFLSTLHAEPQTFDFVVDKEVLVQRCVIDGPSTRMIAVGHPTGHHYAFDALHAAPSYLWSGGFIDFKPEASARGGSQCKILGARQNLPIQVSPLRISLAEEPAEIISFRGYRRSAENGSPTFLASVDGIPFEQTLSIPAPNQAALHLYFPHASPNAPTKFYLLKDGAKVDLSEGLIARSPSLIEIPPSVKDATLTFTLPAPSKEFTRKEEKLSGEALYKLYCIGCHSLDGTKLIGPSFEDLLNREQEVTRDGKKESIKVTGNYLLESITEPQAAIVVGYEAVPMISFKETLTAEQLKSLVDYLKTL